MADGVQVKGVKRLQVKLDTLTGNVDDITDLVKNAGQVFVREAKSLAPRKSGALAGSIRVGTVKNHATVRAGSARVPYASVQNNGGYHNITGRHFMDRAATSKQAAVVAQISAGINGLVHRAGL